MANRTIRSAQQLADKGLLDRSQITEIDKVASRYSIAITHGVAKLIDPLDPNDPIARQFIPSLGELESTDTELLDPIGDGHHSPVKGVVHRYPDRALLKPTHICPVYCRYCFRREFVGPASDGMLSWEELEDCFAYFRAHSEIWEVILTGGDPLILSARRLSEIIQELSAIDHIRVIRIHSRVPTVVPEKINLEVVEALKASSNAVFVVLHVNHCDEFGPDASAACARLIDAGIPVLSQTVLLRNVNDDPRQLGQLMRTLVENRIKPYYLHHCDLAPATSQFRTTIQKGQHIMRELRGNFSGLCQPTYVLDIPGGAGKSPIGPNYLSLNTAYESESAEYTVEDYNGNQYDYACVREDLRTTGTSTDKDDEK